MKSNESQDKSVKFYIAARWAYSLGKPIMMDSEYAKLDKFIKENNLLPEYTQRTWSEDPYPLELLQEMKLHSLMLESEEDVQLTGRVYTSSMESITTEEELFKFYGSMNSPHQLTLKADGWCIQGAYTTNYLTSIETRGRSSKSMHISIDSGLFMDYLNVGNAVLVCEVYITDKNLAKLIKEENLSSDVSQRGAVNTAISKGRFDLLNKQFFSIFRNGKQDSAKNVYEELNNLGLHTSQIEKYVSSYAELLKYLKNPEYERNDLNFPTDGIVIRNVETNECRAIRLFSWKEEELKSYVTGYTDHYGAMVITAGVKIFPIRLKDNLQSNISVTNIKNIVNLDLMPGSPIAFKLVSSTTGVLDYEGTQRLHEKYKGNFERYRKEIEENEKNKEFMREHIGNNHYM